MKALFTSPDVSPRVYDLLFEKTFGSEYIHWLPETLYAEIQDNWGILPTSKVLNKINALKVFKANPEAFYTDPFAFEHIVLAVNGFLFDPDQMLFCEPEDLVYALTTLQADTALFTDPVVGYIKACLEREGFIKAPYALGFAQCAIPAEIKGMVAKISAKSIENMDPGSLVDVQSTKLYLVGELVTERLQKSLAVIAELKEAAL